MPSYKYHLLAGVTTYIILVRLTTLTPQFRHFSLKHYAVFVGFCLLGSIFPDIDIQSYMQKIFFRSLAIALPLALFINTALFIGLSITCLATLFLPHRSLTHHPLFLIMFPLVFAISAAAKYPNHSLIFFTACIYFVAGALSHRLLDVGFARFIPKK
jgi:hypothetical protein